MSEIQILTILGEERLIQIALYYDIVANKARGSYEDGLISIGSGCEDDIKTVSTISHESIHLVLDTLFNKETSRDFDRLYYPNREKLTKILTIDNLEIV